MYDSAAFSELKTELQTFGYMRRILNSNLDKIKLENVGNETSSEDDWNRLGKLVLFCALSAFGTIGNVFAISAVMTEETLKHRGNALLVNLMLASLLVTIGALPIEIVGLLANSKPSPSTCLAKWFLFCIAEHASLMTFLCIATEVRYRMFWKPIPTCLLILMLISSWITAFAIVAFQWSWNIVPQHCSFELKEKIPIDFYLQRVFTSTVAVTLVFLPLTIAFVFNLRTVLSVRPGNTHRVSRSNANEITSNDMVLANVHLVMTVVSGSCWAVGIISDWWASEDLRHTLSWFPITAATCSCYIFAFQKSFREAYVQLFNYCCCKTSVSQISRRSGASLFATSRPTNNDVKLHIIPPYSIYCRGREQRESRLNSGTQTSFDSLHQNYKSRNKRSSRNDVYEL